MKYTFSKSILLQTHQYCFFIFNKKYLQTPRHILPTIVICQFFGTALWFAGNAFLSDLLAANDIPSANVGLFTSVVQAGFILGTLSFALLAIADRFSPSKVFLICSLMGATFNALLIWEGNNLYTLLTIRFFTGFFLAGIYPVGMKIASDYFKSKLSLSLGWLVGALVLGTAFPYFLKSFNIGINYVWATSFISAIAALGGALIYTLVPNGPHRKLGGKLNIKIITSMFKSKSFLKAALGYFGHMWELYAFWVFVPVIIKIFAEANDSSLNNSLLSFIVIASGSFGCILAGYLTKKLATAKVAYGALLSSLTCALLLPFFFWLGSAAAFVTLLIIWGITVVADSPLFSTLVANNVSPEIKGSALTIVNCIGFSITIVSIQLLDYLLNYAQNSITVFWLLTFGPAVALLTAFDRKKAITP